MPKKPRKARPARQPTQIRAWRKHRGDMSLDRLSERLLVEEEFEVSPGQLSRIERGEQPYAQDLLEALARIFNCGPEDLINVDPTKGGIWSLWEGLDTKQRDQAVQMLKVIKGTGTEG